MKHKILLVTTRHHFSAARLAIAFAAARCRVEIVCSPSHPVMLTRDIAVRHPLYALSPIRSLHSVIRKSLPDLIVPTDDLATTYLYRLYEQAPLFDEGMSASIRLLLERSLGEPKSFPLLFSRTRFITAAQAEGIDALPTENLPDVASLYSWLSSNPLPAVLKADGTSGGEGVKIAHTREQAVKAWRDLRAPFGLTQVIKKTTFDRDSHHILPWISRRQRVVSIQPFIQGQDSNIAVACWKGEILGAISFDVLRSYGPNGPGALVELSQDDHMLNTARVMVRRLNLSGLCGFDFITEDATGRMFLIEINARATQTCHLPYGTPRDLISSLTSAMAGSTLPGLNEARKHAIIALFPHAWQAGITKEMLDSTHQDIPWEEPRLVKAGFSGHRSKKANNARKLAFIAAGNEGALGLPVSHRGRMSK